MKILTKKLYPKEDAMIQWHMQAGNITTNLKVKIYFTLPELSATKIVTCNCHEDESTKGRHDMILGRDLLTALRLNLKCSDHVIEVDDGPIKVLTAPMFDLGTYESRELNTGKITPEELFTNAYA